jgi:mannose-6-phosphate isomerase-like protein (cupin superfamily)/lambda repressor-like predicted transcriptional regulator
MPRKAARPTSAATSPSAPPHIDHEVVGARLRAARKARGLTLAELSMQSGVAISTISKAERADIALTYDKFAALAHALQLDFADIFGQRGEAPAEPMTPAFTAAGTQVVYDTPNYEYGLLAHDLTGKRMVPILSHIRARELADFPDFIRHAGEEFVFLLSGSLRLHFENGSEFTLAPGDSLYFDSSVGHIYLSVGEQDAQVLVCCVDIGATPRLNDAI